jgi:hypothetical protein
MCTNHNKTVITSCSHLIKHVVNDVKDLDLGAAAITSCHQSSIGTWAWRLKLLDPFVRGSPDSG